MKKNSLPVGVFDSGVGGISVLAELVRLLPDESFLYFADDLNAPYGTKQTQEVKKYTLESLEFLYEKGIKALVIACNTATSAAIHDIREKNLLPVIGMEPAIKPAVQLHPPGEIVVMATPLTLREKKFQNLLSKYHNEAEIIPLACPGLVELIENTDFHSNRVKAYLVDLLSGIDISKVGAIVLGCTHYLFIKDEIKSLVGPEIALIDGNYGTAKHLYKTLASHDLLSEPLLRSGQQVQFYSTGHSEVTLSKYTKFFNYAIQNIYPK